MEENKEGPDLQDGLESLGELSDFGELSDESLDDLLNDDLFSAEGSGAEFESEFDNLMDLSDFQELDSSDDAIGLDDLLDIQSDDWGAENAKGKEPDETEDMFASMLDGLDENGTLTFSEEESLKEKEIEKKEVEETEDPEPEIKEAEAGAEVGEIEEPEAEIEKAEAPAEESAEDFIDLDAMMDAGEELDSIPEKEEAHDEIEDVLNLGGADLEEKPDLAGIESIDEKLLSDGIEEDEKKEKKAFKEKKAARKKQKAAKEKTDKVGIFQRLFGNVPDENAEKNAAKEAERLAAKEAKKAAKKTKEEIALEKQEKQKEKEEAAAIKKAEQDAKKAQKEEKKKLKLAEKAAAKEARELEEAKEPPTRINRVGAGIILVTFAIIAFAIIGGNNSYAYSQCIAKAAAYFSQKEYTNAYNQIYGVEVKKSDEELKNQVMTVMFVEKQLNSFDNYFAMEMYPEALDSLLKGLDKHAKYLDQARTLGIESDVNYVRDEILEELQSAFNISEKKAYKLLSISNSEEYTKQVINASNAV